MQRVRQSRDKIGLLVSGLLAVIDRRGRIFVTHPLTITDGVPLAHWLPLITFPTVILRCTVVAIRCGLVMDVPHAAAPGAEH